MSINIFSTTIDFFISKLKGKFANFYSLKFHCSHGALQRDFWKKLQKIPPQNVDFSKKIPLTCTMWTMKYKNRNLRKHPLVPVVWIVDSTLVTFPFHICRVSQNMFFKESNLLNEHILGHFIYLWNKSDLSEYICRIPCHPDTIWCCTRCPLQAHTHNSVTHRVLKV